MDFVVVGNKIIRKNLIEYIDLSELENLRVVIHYNNDAIPADGIQVIDLLMEIKPSVLEGKRFRWIRNAWCLHNLIGHPVMQLLAFCKLYKWALYVHDKTVPSPVNTRKSS